MNPSKKEKLAEYDSRWNFEKTVEVPTSEEIEWSKIKNIFNQMQNNNGDLYMTIAGLPLPEGLDKVKQWYRNRQENGQPVTFHHSQVYNFYLKLAYELQVSVGKAVYKTLYRQEELREYFDLGETVNVSINNIEAMDTEENSNVTRDELEEFIENEE